MKASHSFRAEHDDTKKNLRGLFAVPFFQLMGDEFIGRPAEQRHFIFHDAAIGIVQIPRIQESEKQAWGKESFPVVQRDPERVQVMGTWQHASQPQIGPQCSIIKETFTILHRPQPESHNAALHSEGRLPGSPSGAFQVPP